MRPASKKARKSISPSVSISQSQTQTPVFSHVELLASPPIHALVIGSGNRTVLSQPDLTNFSNQSTHALPFHALCVRGRLSLDYCALLSEHESVTFAMGEKSLILDTNEENFLTKPAKKGKTSEPNKQAEIEFVAQTIRKLKDEYQHLTGEILPENESESETDSALAKRLLSSYASVQSLSLVLALTPLNVCDISAQNISLPASSSAAPFHLLLLSNEWKEFLASLSLSPSPRIMLVGRKGRGKSTLMRCIVNTLVSHQNIKKSKSKNSTSSQADSLTTHSLTHGVLLVDTDPGQGELHPPGLISLHSLTAPLLGSQFYSAKHVRMNETDALNDDLKGNAESDRMRVDNEFDDSPILLEHALVGDTSPKSLPVTYSRAVSQLARFETSYNSLTDSTDSHSLPVIINTCGWVQARGGELLSHIAHEMRVTHLVHIIGDEVSELELPPPLKWTQSEESIRVVTLKSLTHSLTHSLTLTIVNTKASQNRLQMWKSTILSAPCFWVPLDAYQVIGLEVTFPENGYPRNSDGSSTRNNRSDLLVALNATVIGIWAENKLLSIGLVRAVDTFLNRILLQTPVKYSSLVTATVFEVTKLELPPEFLSVNTLLRRSRRVSESVSVSEAPYQCLHVLSQFSQATRKYVERGKYKEGDRR